MLGKSHVRLRHAHRPQRPRDSALSRRLGSKLATAAVALLAFVAAGCGAAPPDRTGLGRASTDPPSSATTPTTRPVLATDGTFPVGTTSLDVVEPPTAPGAPSRNLPTQVWYPAVSRSGALAPDHASAPYPLLVFSQGYALAVSAYAALLEDWASAGYVVAAPTYPFTDPSDPAGLNENDIVNHPADLRYVITTVLDTTQQSASPLHGLIDSTKIGIAGHSDGGDVSLAVADNSCCRDPRVKAAAILSGAELAAFGGTYFAAGTPNVPLLVVQGDHDTINYPECSTQIYDSAGYPKYYLDLLGAEHEPPYVDAGGSYEQVVAHVVTDFFDVELKGQAAAAGAMTSDGNIAATAQLTNEATAPVAPGSCPGAPSA